MKKNVILLCTMFLFLGVIIGFLFSPVKRGIIFHNGSNVKPDK